MPPRKKEALLDEALERARDGAEIRLPAGEHRLTRDLTKAVSIAGVGARATRIVLDGRAATSHALSLKDLALVAEETALEVVGSAISLERVNITARGSALFVHGGGAASAWDVRLETPRSGGLELPLVEVRDEQSRVSLTRAVVRGRLGIFAHEGGRVRADECRLRAAQGPCVRAHRAKVELERCTLEGSGAAGVYARARARVFLRACALRGSAFAQVEAHDAFVRVVGGSITGGADDGVDAHEGSRIELESVRLQDNDIGVRVIASRARLRDVVVAGGRGAAVVAEQSALVEIVAGELDAGDAAALEAFDGGVIRATGVRCRNRDGEPVFAYDHGVVEVHPGVPARPVPDADACWEMIEAARSHVAQRRRGGDPDAAIAKRLVEVLAATDIATIVAFDHFVWERMAEAYRWDLWAVAYLMNGGCSDDGFDYFIGWLVGQGRERFTAALRDPERAAEGLGPEQEPFSNEDVLGIGVNAYRRLTGSDQVNDFYAVHRRRVRRKLVGKPFDEETVMAEHPALARFWAGD